MNRPCLMIGLIIAAITLAPQAQAMQVQSIPDNGAPGADIQVSASNLDLNSQYDLRLQDMATEDVLLAQVMTDGNGDVVASIQVPILSAGAYNLVVATGAGAIEASTPFTVLPAPGFGLSPDSGSPGTVVQVSLTGISPGTLTIEYDGVAVLGPLAVDDASFAGQFLVPADRPVPLGQAVAVDAVNRVGRRRISVTSLPFGSLMVPFPEPVFVRNIRIPASPVVAGNSFVVGGQLVVPTGDPASYQLTLVWKTISGQMIPINISPAVIDSDGNFSFGGLPPSVVAGTAYFDWGITDELGLVYKNPPGNLGRFIGLGAVDYDNFDTQFMTVHVENSQGEPIENAIVVLSPHDAVLVNPNLPRVDVQAKASVVSYKGSQAAFNYTANQIKDALESIKEATIPETGCPITLANGLTDENGDFEFAIFPKITEIGVLGAQSVNELDINTTVNSPGFLTFRIRVSAVSKGFADINTSGICSGRRFDIQYDFVQDVWLRRDGPEGAFTIPFNPDFPQEVIFLACEGDLEFPAEPRILGLPKSTVKKNGENITIIPGLKTYAHANGANVFVVQPAELSMPHDATVFGAPDNVHLFFGNEDIGEMVQEGDACGGDAIHYKIVLPNMEIRPPGTIAATIEGTLLATGDTYSRKLEIQVESGPDWIANAQDFENRAVTWFPEKQDLTADEKTYSRTANASNIPSGVGDLDNDNISEAALFQHISLAGTYKKRTGSSSSTVANQATSGNNEVTSIAGAQQSFGSTTPVTVLDTGKIPLFKYVWGIPPIASASIGADIWFKSLYRYFGTTSFTDLGVLTSYTAEATGTAGLDLFFDLSVILGLVSAHANASPIFALGMPIVVQNNVFSSSLSQPCFNFKLDVSYEVSVGICDFCITAGDTVNLFTVKKPSGCSVVTAARQSQGLIQLPQVDRISLAVDNAGQVMTVWRGDDGSLQTQLMVAGQIAASASLIAGLGVSSPDVAYYDAGKAVMVWSESSLDEASFLALPDVASAAATLRLKYRLWDGSSWGSDVDLTPPSTGEGNVVLAGCMAGQPGCPANGEVVAVWIRDMAGDFNQHQFRLYYALFDGTGWNTPQPLALPNVAKDSQPAVAYLNGDPVVVFVRNPVAVAGNLQLEQRRLAYRVIGQVAGVLEIPGFPKGVASPSLAVAPSGKMLLAYSVTDDPVNGFIGGRRALHVAQGGDCTAGVCTWSQLLWNDSNGRKIFVERPVALLDANDQATVFFRHLGNDSVLPNDPPGAIMGTGDSGKIEFSLEGFDNLQTLAADVTALSINGAINWHGAAVLDGFTNTLVTSVVQGQVISARNLALLDQPRTRVFGMETKLLGDGVLLGVMPHLPDFELLDATADATVIEPGQTLIIDVTLKNNGTDWMSDEDLEVSAFWDGPAGLGDLADSQVLGSLLPGVPVMLQLSTVVPAGFIRNDLLHQLHVVVNPGQTLEESAAGNNEIIITLGELPPPQNLAASFDLDAELALLSWGAVTDPRVSGFRVYRKNPDGSVLAVGTSSVNGFVDQSTYPGYSYEYFVTSMSDELVESPPSETVGLVSFDEFIHADGFESPEN